MSPEAIAIIGVGVATLGVGASLAALILSGHRSLRTEIHAVRTDLTTEIRSLRAEVHALAERVARLEGAVPFLAPRPLPSPEESETQPTA